MKSILTIVVFTVLSNLPIFGQIVNYPKGAYMSFDELQRKAPSISVHLEIERRTKGDIKMNGGNDYKLYSMDKSISKKNIKKEYFGYSSGDTLYINGIHYKIQPWYAPVLSDGKFLVIRGGISMEPKTQKEQLKNKDQLGFLLGPLGGGLQGAKLALLRFIYVIDKENNRIVTVTSDYLKELLSLEPDLLDQYLSEKEPENQEIFVKYLRFYNTK